MSWGEIIIAVLVGGNIALTVYGILINEVIKMGLKEDFDTLTTRFDALDSATTAIADDVAALKQEIADANAASNVDLSGLIARAEGIEARLRTTAGPAAGSDPVVEPTPEPAPEG